jgi:solute carrier family 25 S-adenosylmethionine transporter 26
LKGCLQTSSFALFTGALLFGIFEVVNPHYGPLVASACCAAGSCLSSVPQEVIKQRIVTGVYSSFRDAATQIWKTEGILGFYSGWRPTMSRNVPFAVTTFTSREVIRERILKRKQQHTNNDHLATLTTTENIGIGIASALIATIVTQPMDVIKTRMMTQAASKALPYANALDCATSIVRTEGWRKLYSGFGQRSVFMCGLWGITFGLEPMVSNFLEGSKKQSP